MSTRHVYACNVCRQEFPNPDGILFGFNFAPVPGGEEWRGDFYNNANNHICAQCLDNAASFHRKMRQQQMAAANKKDSQ